MSNLVHYAHLISISDVPPKKKAKKIQKSLVPPPAVPDMHLTSELQSSRLVYDHNENEWQW